MTINESPIVHHKHICFLCRRSYEEVDGCFFNFSAYTIVGETLAILCLAKDKDQARLVFRYVKAILHHIPALRSMIVEQRADGSDPDAAS